MSRSVLNGLSRVLLLTPTERAHLFRLAGLDLPADPGPPRPVDPTLRRLVAVLQPHPAYVVNPWWCVLAHNPAYDNLLGGLAQRPPAERNTLWLTFTDRATRGSSSTGTARPASSSASCATTSPATPTTPAAPAWSPT